MTPRIPGRPRRAELRVDGTRVDDLDDLPHAITKRARSRAAQRDDRQKDWRAFTCNLTDYGDVAHRVFLGRDRRVDLRYVPLGRNRFEARRRYYRLIDELEWERDEIVAEGPTWDGETLTVDQFLARLPVARRRSMRALLRHAVAFFDRPMNEITPDGVVMWGLTLLGNKFPHHAQVDKPVNAGKPFANRVYALRQLFDAARSAGVVPPDYNPVTLALATRYERTTHAHDVTWVYPAPGVPPIALTNLDKRRHRPMLHARPSILAELMKVGRTK